MSRGAEADPEVLLKESEVGHAGSASDPSLAFHGRPEVGDPASERLQNQAFDGSNAALPDRQSNLRSSLLSGVAASNRQPRRPASKLTYSLKGLLFLLLAAAAVSSGFLLLESKAFETPSPSLEAKKAVGPPPPAEAPLPPFEAQLPAEAVAFGEPEPKKAEDEIKQRAEEAPGVVAPKGEEEEQLQPEEAEAVAGEEKGQDQALREALSANPLTEEGRKVIAEAFGLTFGRKSPSGVVPAEFTRTSVRGLAQFSSFRASYKEELDGGREIDEEVRERGKRWALYKMHMALLANMEARSREQLEQLSQSQDGREALLETKAQLQEIYQAKEEHYEQALARLNGVGDMSTAKAASKRNPLGVFRKMLAALPARSCVIKESNAQFSFYRDFASNSAAAEPRCFSHIILTKLTHSTHTASLAASLQQLPLDVSVSLLAAGRRQGQLSCSYQGRRWLRPLSSCTERPDVVYSQRDDSAASQAELAASKLTEGNSFRSQAVEALNEAEAAESATTDRIEKPAAASESSIAEVLGTRDGPSDWRPQRAGVPRKRKTRPLVGRTGHSPWQTEAYAFCNRADSRCRVRLFYSRDLRMLSKVAADSEVSYEESEAGTGGSAPETSVYSHLESEVEETVVEPPQIEAFEVSHVNQHAPHLGVKSSLSNRVPEATQLSGAAAFKQRRHIAGLVFFLLAAVAASSGILLSARKRGEGPFLLPPAAVGEKAGSRPATAVPLPPLEAPVPFGEEDGGVQEPEQKPEEEDSRPRAEAPGAAVSEAEEKKQLKPGEEGAEADELVEGERQKAGKAVSASPMTAERADFIAKAFALTFGNGTPDGLFPSFLRGRPEAVKHFNSFLADYKADLEGGEERDEGAREAKRHWTLYKMQMATLTNLEVESREQLDSQSQSSENQKALREWESTVQQIRELKLDYVKFWMGLAMDGRLHPDRTKGEAVVDLLKVQKVHYEMALSHLNGPAEMSTSHEGTDEDLQLVFQELCGQLEGRDQWLRFTMP
ncbi:hypothetical protein ACSSS7_004865 [Eimeria intestinalis]